MSLRDLCPIIEFDDLGDERGKLVVIEGGKTIPFDIQRVFYIYGSDKNTIRGQHANKRSEFILINVSGSSKIRITDTHEEYVVDLNCPLKGIYIPKMIWKDMFGFSSDSVLLALSNSHYDEKEYIRDYEEYVELMALR